MTCRCLREVTGAMTRRSDRAILGVAGIVLAGFLALALLAGAGLLDAPANEVVAASSGYGVATPVSAQSAAAAYPAWYDGETSYYFDLGANTPLDGETVLTAPIWSFIRGFDEDGRAQHIEGHPALFDVVPGDDGYSDLWKLRYVIVPEGYDTSEIRSLTALEASGLEIVVTDTLLNCPVLADGEQSPDGSEPMVAWYRGEEAHYVSFGPTPATPVTTWTLISGYDGAGLPVPVPGQYPIVDGDPDDDGYSDFQRVYYVTVDADYEPNSIRSGEQVAASGFPVTQTTVLLNRPPLPEPES